MLRGALAYTSAIGLDIPAALFNYVHSTRAPLFSKFLVSSKATRYLEASPVYTNGLRSLDRQLPFIATGKDNVGLHVKGNLQLIDRWIQSATIGTWMSPTMMDVVDQALVIGNVPGLSEKERFIIVAALGARVEAITAARHTNVRAESAAGSTRQRRKALIESSSLISQSCDACRARCSAGQTGLSRRFRASKVAKELKQRLALHVLGAKMRQWARQLRTIAPQFRVGARLRKQSRGRRTLWAE